jgi:hypothetical protein
VDIQCFHFNPPSEAAVNQPEAQEAKVSKLKMAHEAENILDKVDGIMVMMDLYPVPDIEDEFLENILLKVKVMDSDAQACRKLFRSWKRMYAKEAGAALKQQLEVKVNNMRADFQIYRSDMAAKVKIFQAKHPPPAPPAPSPSCPEPGYAWLCSEQDQTPKLQLGYQVPGSVMTLAAVSQHVHSGGQDLVNNLQQKEDENRAMQMTAKFEDTAFAKYLPLEKTKTELLTVKADVGNKFLDKKPAMDVTGKKRREPLEAPKDLVRETKSEVSMEEKLEIKNESLFSSQEKSDFPSKLLKILFVMMPVLMSILLLLPGSAMTTLGVAWLTTISTRM